MNLVQKEGEELCLDYARPCYKGSEEVSVAKESCKSFAQITRGCLWYMRAQLGYPWC